MVNRVLRDDPSKGDMHNRQELNLGMLWQCLKDYHMWPIYLIGLSWMIPAVPMNNYLTLQLKSVGFGTFETNLLTIPAYVILIMNVLFFTWLSEKLKWWALPLIIALEVGKGIVCGSNACAWLPACACC